MLYSSDSNPKHPYFGYSSEMSQTVERPISLLYPTTIVASGEIESAYLTGQSKSCAVMCKVFIFHEKPWILSKGNATVVTSISHSRNLLDALLSEKTRHFLDVPIGDEFSFNTPFSWKLEANRPTSWPRILITLYGTDWLGRSRVYGYGSLHTPLHTRRSVNYIQLFHPLEETQLDAWKNWITCNHLEFIDHTILAKSENRDVLRVQTKAQIKLNLNVIVNEEAHSMDGHISTE